MKQYERVFKSGNRAILVTAFVYKSIRSLRKRMKRFNIDGLCYKDTMGDYNILLSEKGLLDGTAEHEATHVMQFAEIKNQEKQAELVEQISTWLRGLYD